MDLCTIFHNIGSRYYNFPLNETSYNRNSYIDSNAMRCFLHFKMVDNCIEIPMMLRDRVGLLMTMESRGYLSKISDMAIPLYCNYSLSTARTSDTIIRKLMSNTLQARFVAINSAKGKVYIGNRGIIFTEDYNLIISYNCRIKRTEEGKWEFLPPVLRINPEVFRNQQDAFNKALIHKFIPEVLASHIYVAESNDIEGKTFDNVKIVIDDVSPFVVTATKPTPSSYSNDSVNKCLLDNLDDLETLFQ